MAKNHYDTLGLPTFTSDTAEIKNAYRRLAKRYHPDRNSGDAAAEEMFKDASAAYNVLSHPEMKETYDLSLRASNGRRGGRSHVRPDFVPEAERSRQARDLDDELDRLAEEQLERDGFYEHPPKRDYQEEFRDWASRTQRKTADWVDRSSNDAGEWLDETGEQVGKAAKQAAGSVSKLIDGLFK